MELKDKLESLYQFISGAAYASTGAPSQVLSCACERLDEIIKELDLMPETDYNCMRGMSVPVETNPSRD
jgi:hypothetical protein